MTIFDRKGKVITLLEWPTIQKRVVVTNFVTGIRVSTVHLGLDHSFDPNTNSPIIFETMTFNASGVDLLQDRYITEQEAIQGHLRIIKSFYPIPGITTIIPNILLDKLNAT